MNFIMGLLKSVLLTCLLTITGCATQAAPNFIGGRYYWAGDAACTKYERISSSRINCGDHTGKITGFRDAMSDQELYMYQMNMARAEARHAASMAALDAQNAAMNANTAAQLRSISSMSTPMPASITRPGGYDVQCLSVGIYTNCRY